MSRIAIQLGSNRIEYDGDQEYIENKLLDMIRDVLDLSAQLPQATTLSTDTPTSHSTDSSLSTNTIAQILSAKTGADLVVAAIARINLVKGQSTATRQEVLEEMKEAATYYRDSYASNLSTYLTTLVRNNRLNLVARSTYALSASERSRLESALPSGS